MDPKAISQVRPRLERAAAAIARLESATDFHDIEESWVDFVQAISTIYNKLEQGAKANGKSNAWFGRIKNARRKDGLLSYVHHARDSDQHGIEDLVKHVQKEYRLKVPIEFPGLTLTGISVDPDGWLGDTEYCDGKSPPKKADMTEISIIHDVAQLVTVYDTKHKDHFDPPTEHLGQCITDITPLNISRLAYDYVVAMVGKAETFIDAIPG